MKLQDYFALIDRFESSSLTCLEIEEEAYRVHMEKGGSSSAQATTSKTKGFFEGCSEEPVGNGGDCGSKCSGSVDRECGKIKGEKEKTESTESSWVEVKAPLVGVFYAAPSPEAPPFVQVGDRVEQGQVLCLVEAMKMMNQLKSPVSGIVRGIGGVDGELAEYGQVLFEVEPC